jgi:death on curing protein
VRLPSDGENARRGGLDSACGHRSPARPFTGRARERAVGLRDGALLQSALARPQHLAASKDPDLCALAAAYAAGIARNHSFVDANKRMAFMTAYVFLARNGLRLMAPEDQATYRMLALAVGEINEAAFAVWLRSNTLKID